jgi:DNA-binding NtrC family response regulator
MTEKNSIAHAVCATGPSVLVVDDELDFLETLVKRLERRGFHVTGVGGASEALKLLEEKRYDVIVSDVLMPGMNGIELLHEIKTRWESTQVILLSGHGGEDIDLRGMAYGAYAYLVKPVSLNTLVETVHKAFEESGLR